MAITVNAHITGTVWKINVKVGDAVAEGETVAILESMKMEMPVESPAAGKVAAVLAKEGASIEEGAPLLELTPGLKMGPPALVVLAAAALAGALAPPPGTTRVFGHICEEAHLQEIVRAHALPGARMKIDGRKRASKGASKKGEPRPPVTLCVLGDFGFSRANIYVQLEAGQRLWLYDAATADRLAAATPVVTLALDFDARGSWSAAPAASRCRPRLSGLGGWGGGRGLARPRRGEAARARAR